MRSARQDHLKLRRCPAVDPTPAASALERVLLLAIFSLAVACGGSATSVPSPTASPALTPTASPAPTPTVTPTVIREGALPSAEAGRPVLTAVRVDRPPITDGRVESLWEVAPELVLPLARKRGEGASVGDVVVQSVHHKGWIYFLARWSEPSPGGVPGPWVSNKLSVIWHDALLSKKPRDCATVCHTAYTATQRDIDMIRPVSIPAGDERPFDGRGRWEDGHWTLEWRRQFMTDNPLDVQFDDPTAAYVFQVAVTAGQDGEISLVSPWAELRFSPPGE